MNLFVVVWLKYNLNERRLLLELHSSSAVFVYLNIVNHFVGSSAV